MKNTILRLEIGGAVFAFFFGSVMHFVYEWCGNSPVAGFFCPVNESTWEHLKMIYWPIVAWGIMEYFIYGKEKPGFFTAKAAAIYIAPVTIVVTFYGYLWMFSENSLLYTIFIFGLAAALAYIASYKITISAANSGIVRIVSIILIILSLIMFSFFTFFPPENFLFLDHLSGGYGIN